MKLENPFAKVPQDIKVERINSAYLLPKRLRMAREYRGLTQEELGKLVNIVPTNISYYEGGKRLPSAQGVVKLANALRTSTDFLLGRTNSMHAPPDVAPRYGLLAIYCEHMSEEHYEILVSVAKAFAKE